MASLDLWIEGSWGKATINWHEADVPFDLDRFHYDQHYAEQVDRYVKDALAYLSEGLSEISRYTPRAPEEDWTHCE